MSKLRAKIKAALAKPVPQEIGAFEDEFDPWEDVISGIHGGYSSQSDDLMIAALEAVRDRKTFEFMTATGFAGEFALYVLSGHGLTEYGTSPRGAWPDPEIADLWDALIDKWKAHRKAAWEAPTQQQHVRG